AVQQGSVPRVAMEATVAAAAVEVAVAAIEKLTAISARHTGALQHVRNPDLGAALAFALVCGFHESKEFNRLLRRNGRDSGPEELDHFNDERIIAIVSAHRALAFLSLRSPS